MLSKSSSEPHPGHFPIRRFYSRIFALEAAVPVSPIVFASQRRVPAARDARWTDSACRGGESGSG